MEKLTLGVVGVVVIIAAIFAYRYIKNKSNGKEEAKKFLEELQEQMYLIVIEIINKIDIGSFKNFEDYQKAVLEAVYAGCWDFVDKKIAEAEDGTLISVIAKKILTKEYVEKFIDSLLEQKDIPDTLMNVYGSIAIKSKEAEEFENEFQERFSDDSQYNENIEVAKEDLLPAEEIQHSEEEEAALNPQTDEEEEYSDTDESVEPVNDYIISKVNKAGKQMYYLIDGASGKRKQVSKQYVMEAGLEIKHED